MIPPELRALYCYVSEQDHARIKEMAKADRVTVSALIRGFVEDYLESVGAPGLEDVRPQGRPPRRAAQRRKTHAA